jgi:hypothetical protein
MGFVKAGPNEYLLVGRRGTLENRGSAVQAYLRPGTVWARVPASKQEAGFEFTQESKDGIPLRFKGIVVFRITDPVAAAGLFDFAGDEGTGQVSRLLVDVTLGELRHAVSHMTMAECIEQRKTTLSGVVRDALEAVTRGGPSGDVAGADPAAPAGGWGITIEVAQVAQVFIVDAGLRQQLEAEVRNEIKVRSDESNVRAREETRLAEMASEARVQEQQLASDRDALRRREELELAELARQRRMTVEDLATQRQALELEQERFRVEQEAARDRIEVEAPVRLLRVARESEALREELGMHRLRNDVETLDVERQLLLPRARQDLRREILPLEQAPRIVESASKVLQGTNLSVYGEDGRLVGQLAPLLELVGSAVRRASGETPAS